MNFLLLILSLYSTAKLPHATASKVNLSIEVTNIQSQKGAVYLALFRAGDAFPTGKPAEGKKVDIKGSSVQASFSVEPGNYAVAVFHDENGNGKMDKRVFGIPKEPYGFSNNFRPKMSAPKFSDCQIQVGNNGKAIQIEIK
jgi:uncharacterized protein (DUF2141 family)